MKTRYGTKGTNLKEGRESVALGNKLETTKPSVPIRNTAIKVLLRFRRHTEFEKDGNIVATRCVMASHLKEDD
jgi:hypothetical protein